MATKTLVLLGIGHTNAHIVKEWAEHGIADCRLICISTYPTATYSGMLPGTLGQQFDDVEMRIDLPSLAAMAGAELILAPVSGLDLVRGELLFPHRDPIRFDALSIGVGSMPVGWQSFSDVSQFVPIKPMQTFLQRLQQRLSVSGEDSAAPRTIAIVGGGVASIEIALCLQQRLKRQGRDAVTIEIYTASERVADGMTARSVRRIESILHQRGIVVHTGQRVIDVGETSLVTADLVHHPSDVIVWATGAGPPAILEALGLQSDERGFIATHNTLQTISDPRVFAVGDCGTVMESPAPKAGVYAVRQCPILWHNLRELLTGGASLKPFQPQSNFLKLLNTGDGKALLEYGRITVHAAWCWYLKTWIDKRFIAEYRRSHPISDTR
jgi:selenide,water dikinase